MPKENHFMDNMMITLIYPPVLGRIKPYQNLSLIISGMALIIAFTLSWLDNKLISDIAMYLFLSGILFLILFIILNLAFLLKRTEINIITNGVLSVDIDRMPMELHIHKLKFLLNIDSKLLENEEYLVSDITKDLSVWGNYIIIPSENSVKDIYIQFIPDESFLKTRSQLKIETYKSSSILMSDTTDLMKNFINMLGAASSR